MKATNFNNKDSLQKINEVLQFVLENPYSDFYRNKYKNQIPKNISSYEDFQKIPFLTKDEILAIPIKDRTFIPEEKIAYYSFSSGTTKSKLPTIIPHSDFNLNVFLKYVYREDKLKSMGVKKVMILRPPTSPLFSKFMAVPGRKIIIIPGDIKNLNLSAKLSKELEIEGLITTPTILDFFISSLEENNFDLKKIKYVKMGGEHCSKQKLNYFKKILPNANFNLGYGSSESGGPQGYQCEFLEVKNTSAKFHPVDSLLFEIAENDGISEFKKSGTIIMTDLKGKAFPLIRYETDDVGILSQEECSCGEKLVLDLGGKESFNNFKFSGVTLNIQMVENSLMPLENIIFPTRFQMHIFEENINGKIKPKLKIILQVKKGFEKDRNNPLFKENIQEAISKKLYLSEISSLESLVEKNIFLPLEVEFTDKWPEGKAKPIISHLS